MLTCIPVARQYLPQCLRALRSGGCGPPVGYGGAHVVSNAAMLMVRYIFLIPASVTTVPAPANIALAMLSVYSSLRAGAL